MKIMIMRHAEAASRTESGVPYDAERPLTDRGREQSRWVGRLLRCIGCVPDPVVASPFVRTQETAAIICQQFAEDISPLPLSILAPGSGSEEVLRAALNYGQAEQRWMLAVLHEPDVSYVLGCLLFDGAKYPFQVNPGDIFGLNVSRGRGLCFGDLVFSYSPALLAQVGDLALPAPAAEMA